MILNIFLFILFLFISVSSALAFGGSRKGFIDDSFYNGVHAIGIHWNGPEQPTSTKTIYCEHTNNTGTCTSWAECPYESSEDKIVGIPWADGGCAPDENHRVVCLDTADGVCDSWAEPCLKTDEYHELINVKGLARSFCCDIGHSYCASTNDLGQCNFWDCCDTTNHTGDSIVGQQYARGACASDTNDRLVCLETNEAGTCTNWHACSQTNEYPDIIDTPNAHGYCCAPGHAYCLYASEGKCHQWECCDTTEHTGANFIGTAEIHGECISDENYRLMCFETDNAGTCTSWSSCLKTNDYFDVAELPNAHGACCAPGTAHCNRYNNTHQCIHWRCNVTCSEDDRYVYCNQDECAGLGNHFAWNEEGVGYCTCAPGYKGTTCNECIEPDYVSDGQGNCIPAECQTDSDCDTLYERCNTTTHKCVFKCDNDEFANTEGSCFKCTEEDVIVATQKQCDKCENERFSYTEDRTDGLVWCRAM